MIDGIKKLRRVQIGAETTAGTAVAATTIMRIAGAALQDDRDVQFPEEDVGLLVSTDRNYVASLQGSFPSGDNPATFEQIGYYFEAGIKKVGTGVADGPGSGRIYTYTFPTTTPNVIQTYTIESGDNVDVERLEYAFVQKINISGKPKEVIQVSADWVGRQVTPITSFTAGLSIPPVEEIVFQKSRLYIDDASGTIGTTLVSGTLLGFEAELETGLVPVFSGDGELFFNRLKQVGPTGSLKITFEHNGSAVAEKLNWRNKVSRAVRLKIEGSSFTTAGTTYPAKTLQIDLCGRWATFDKLDESDGNDVVTGTLQIGYNATQALWGRITVVNALPSLP